MKKNLLTQIDISPTTVAKSTFAVLVVLLAVALVFRISDILMIFFVAFLIAAGLDPLIDRLQERKVPRSLSVLLVYLLFFVMIFLLLGMVLPVVVEQLTAIINVIGKFLADLSTQNVHNYPFSNYLQLLDTKTVILKLQESITLITQQLINVGGNIWDILMLLTNGFFNLIIIAVLVFFITIDESAVEKFCQSLFPDKHSILVSEIMVKIKEKVGHWIRGQMIISFVSGFATYVLLSIFGVQYALTHAVIVAVMMIIPVFGRMFAWFVSAPIVFSQSPGLALALTIIYFVLSIFENNFLQPILMNKAVGLSPILIMFCLMVGYNLLGIMGLILAIPVTMIIVLIIKDVSQKTTPKKI